MMFRDFKKELEALGELPAKGRLLDLGCGKGRHSLAFFEDGWECVFVDKDEEVVKELPEKVCVSDIHEFMKNNKDTFDVIIANNSLFFLGENFGDVMTMIYRSLNPGGVFIGSLLGENDQWKQFIQHNAKEVKQLLSPYKNISLTEEYSKLPLMSGGFKNWHRFEFVVKK